MFSRDSAAFKKFFFFFFGLWIQLSQKISNPKKKNKFYLSACQMLKSRFEKLCEMVFKVILSQEFEVQLTSFKANPFFNFAMSDERMISLSQLWEPTARRKRTSGCFVHICF